jgi:hypothetical protein
MDVVRLAGPGQQGRTALAGAALAWLLRSLPESPITQPFNSRSLTTSKQRFNRVVRRLHNKCASVLQCDPDYRACASFDLHNIARTR